jgi:hypothetical protein
METQKEQQDTVPDKEFFRFETNYNCKELVNQRKKNEKMGWFFVAFGMLFIIPTVLIGMSYNPTKSAVVILFLVTATIMGSGLYLVIYNKENPKNNSKTMVFTFFENYTHFRINNEAKNKVKDLSKCLYRSYKNLQYVYSVTRTPDFISFKILTGTYNMAPQFAKYDIPISCIGSDLNEFEDFIKERLGTDYKIKKQKI